MEAQPTRAFGPARTVLLMLWLPLRLRRRGSFGPVASGAIRCASPLLFGLGGWFAGALVVMMALPTVPITDELLVALSAGPPERPSAPTCPSSPSTSHGTGRRMIASPSAP